MAYYIHYTDPNSGAMVDVLSKIPPCPGICFFIDITRSTDIKYVGGLQEWGRKLNNTFNNLLYANHFQSHIVKGIGDEIMLFIPDPVLEAKPVNNTCFALLEDLYAALFLIKNHPNQDLFLSCKVAIHYCTEVYNITFFDGAEDFYGIDVDLTARLMSKSLENRIVLSEPFYERIIREVTELGIPSTTGCLSLVSGRIEASFRGVPVETGYRVIDV